MAFHAQGCKVGILDYDAAAGRGTRATAWRARAFRAHRRARHPGVAGRHPPRERCARPDHDPRSTTLPATTATPIDEVTPEYWRERFATNLDHQFFATQAVLPDMDGGGRRIGDQHGLDQLSRRATDSFAAYKTAKSAVLGLTRALARELGPRNIRVNSIVPGWIMTQRQIDLWLTPESEAELMKRQCIKRRLVPEDVANDGAVPRLRRCRRDHRAELSGGWRLGLIFLGA